MQIDLVIDVVGWVTHVLDLGGGGGEVRLGGGGGGFRQWGA